MSFRSLLEIQGFEHDWLCSDALGNVGLFTTGGGGWAPEDYLRRADVHAAAVRTLLSGPKGTTAVFAPSLGAEYENDWRGAAERGVFAFDCDANGGPYRLVAKPLIAVTLAQVPPDVHAAAARVHLGLARFGALADGASLTPSAVLGEVPRRVGDKECPVPHVWRGTLAGMVAALVRGGELPAWSSADSWRVSREYIADYGEELLELPEQAWASSFASWQGQDAWDVYVNLWTRESGASDMVMAVRVSESSAGFSLQLLSVYVP